MRRTFVLGIIVLGGVITTSLLAAQGGAPAGQGREGRAGGGGGGGGRGPGFPPVQAIEKVKDNLYLIQGQGGNTAVYVAQTGVVVVDTKLANNGQAILDQIKTVTDKPITHTPPRPAKTPRDRRRNGVGVASATPTGRVSGIN